MAAATVSKGWSGYIYEFFWGIGVNLPPQLSKLKAGVVSFDFLAVLILLILTGLLVVGVQESSKTNMVLMVITIAIMLLLIISGATVSSTSNWTPFLPFGASGIFVGASIVFFSFIGFDGVTTVAEEMKNPKRVHF